MNIAKTVVLLAGLVSAGSMLAQDSEGWGRHAKNPREVILVQEPNSSDVFFSRVRGHIDADVLNFHHKDEALQAII